MIEAADLVCAFVVRSPFVGYFTVDYTPLSALYAPVPIRGGFGCCGGACVQGLGVLSAR